MQVFLYELVCFGGCAGRPAGNLVVSGAFSLSALVRLFHVEQLSFKLAGGNPSTLFHVEHWGVGARIVEGKEGGERIPVLDLHAGKIDGTAQKAAGGAGFQPGQLNSGLEE